jgi:hypothetical protein
MATADSMARAAGVKRAAAAKKKRDALVKKGTTPRMSADRLSGAKYTNTNAGRVTGTQIKRAAQNSTVKHGTVRLGAKGKAYNKYDALSATWKKVQATGATKKAKSSAKPKLPKSSSRWWEPKRNWS